MATAARRTAAPHPADDTSREVNVSEAHNKDLTRFARSDSMMHVVCSSDPMTLVRLHRTMDTFLSDCCQCAQPTRPSRQVVVCQVCILRSGAVTPKVTSLYAFFIRLATSDIVYMCVWERERNKKPSCRTSKVTPNIHGTTTQPTTKSKLLSARILRY